MNHLYAELIVASYELLIVLVQQLERWSDAMRDYEALRKALPDDNEVAESLFHAQVALKKSRGEEVHNLKFGGEVEEVSSLDQFKAAVSLPGTVLLGILDSTSLPLSIINSNLSEW